MITKKAWKRLIWPYERLKIDYPSEKVHLLHLREMKRKLRRRLAHLRHKRHKRPSLRQWESLLSHDSMGWEKSIFPRFTPKQNRQQLWQSQPRRGTRRVRALTIKSTGIRDRFYFPMEVEGVKMEAFLDSGSETCLLSEDLFERLPGHHLFPDSKLQEVLIDVNGREIEQSRAPKRMTFKIGSRVIEHDVFIVSQPGEFLVGACFMNEAQINVIRKKDHTLPFLYTGYEGKLENETPLRPHRQHDFQLLNRFREVLKPFETKVMMVSHTLGHEDPFGRLAVVKSDVESQPLQCLEGLVDLKQDHLLVGVTNVSSDLMVIEEGTQVGQGRTLGLNGEILTKDGLVTESPVGPMTVRTVRKGGKEEDLLEGFEEWDPDTEPEGLGLPSESEQIDFEDGIRKHPTIPERFKEEMITFLKEEVPGLCSKHEFDFGTLAGDQDFDIELKQEGYFTSKPYKMNYIRQQQLDFAINELVKAGLLKKGDSPWTSPVFLIPKAEDSHGVRRTRLIMDMRKLNENTIKSHYPLPHIRTLLEDLQGAKLMSIFDLKSAFYNCRMSDRAKKRAAIITASGIYLPQRMIMGLCNAPSFFASVIAECLRGLEHFARSYIDDIICFTKSGDEREHFEHIKATLRRLHQSGMKINVLKGEFFAKEVKFLGRIINEDGMRPTPDNIKSIQQYPSPKDRKGLQRFLGLVTWVSCFIYDYSRHVKPLTQLVSTKRPFQWGPSEEEAFNKLKSLICHKTTTYYPDFSQPMYLCTDVCESSYAGILYQVKTYHVNDIEKLKLAELEGEKYPQEITTVHPRLPKEGKGCPPPLNLAKVDLTPMMEDQQFKIVKLVTKEPKDEQIHIVRPIGYHSGVFSGAEKNYTVLEKETKGLLKNIHHFQQYLYCSPHAYIVTDSQSFLWTLRFKSLGISRLERMCIKLLSLPYKIIVCHQKGTTLAADFLTRLWMLPTDGQGITNFTAKWATVVRTPFSVGQVIETKDIISALEGDPSLVYVPSKEEIKQLKTGKVWTPLQYHRTRIEAHRGSQFPEEVGVVL